MNLTDHEGRVCRGQLNVPGGFLWIGSLKLQFQRLQLRDVAFKNNNRTGNAVMVPATPVPNFQAPVTTQDPVARIPLAIVRL
jgi:hypothetical protein